MGRFSPTVTPVPDLGLANALGAFTESFMQAQNRKDRKDREDQRFDADMLGQGYRPQSDDELEAALANQPQPLVPGGKPQRMPGMQVSDPEGRASLARALEMDESGNELVPRQGTPPIQIGKKRYVQTDEARAAAEERKRASALAAALGEAQIGNYQSQVRDRDRPKPVAPVVGSPEWLKAMGLVAVVRARANAQYGYHAPQSDDRTLVPVQHPDGSVVYTRRTEAEGELAPSPNARGSATIMKDVASNKTNLSVIDDALAELNAHPEAVGLKRGAADLPIIGGAADAINQRVDPEGVAARASLANVSSLVIKDRSGAAVTVSESARLRPFIPSSGDTPDAIRTKLRKLKTAIETETRLLQQSGGMPSRPGGAAADNTAPRGASKAQQLWDAAAAKHGEETVLQRFGPRPR